MNNSIKIKSEIEIAELQIKAIIDKLDFSNRIFDLIKDKFNPKYFDCESIKFDIPESMVIFPTDNFQISVMIDFNLKRKSEI